MQTITARSAAVHAAVQAAPRAGVLALGRLVVRQVVFKAVSSGL